MTKSGMGKKFAICDQCKKEMVKGGSCIPTHWPNGKAAIKYRGGWGVGETPDRCHDCNCRIGGYHHAGCDVERCPCGMQALMGCDECLTPENAAV